MDIKNYMLGYCFGAVIVLQVKQCSSQPPKATQLQETIIKPHAPIFCNAFTEYRNGLITDTLFVKQIIYIK